jgi:thiol-disulfide isomerase/thioredoxin
MTLRLARLLAAAALASLAAGPSGATAAAGDSAPAAAAADFYGRSIPDADGNAWSAGASMGRILVVNFWATWCAPCVAEMPQLEQLQTEFAARGVTIVGLGSESTERVRRFRQQHAFHFTLLAGGIDSLTIARNLGDQQGVLPYTAVFSRRGTLLHTQLGALKPGQLRGWLTAALAQERPSP